MKYININITSIASRINIQSFQTVEVTEMTQISVAN